MRVNAVIALCCVAASLAPSAAVLRRATATQEVVLEQVGVVGGRR